MYNVIIILARFRDMTVCEYLLRTALWTYGLNGYSKVASPLQFGQAYVATRDYNLRNIRITIDYKESICK
jgi:hypothetical protein